MQRRCLEEEKQRQLGAREAHVELVGIGGETPLNGVQERGEMRIELTLDAVSGQGTVVLQIKADHEVGVLHLGGHALAAKDLVLGLSRSLHSQSLVGGEFLQGRIIQQQRLQNGRHVR